MAGHIVPTRVYVTIFALLIGLTGLTTWVAMYDLGRWNTILALAIAISKASLVILFFMHVKYTNNLTRIVVVAGFFWLALLISLTLSDIVTRHWIPVAEGWQTSSSQTVR